MRTKLIIAGGVAGGATAAARARRLDETADIILFERGQYISFANCGLPYHIGGVINQRDDLLVTTAEEFKSRYRVDVRPLCEVIAIHRAEKQVEVREVQTGRTYRETYDSLILSPGAAPLRPPIPGIDRQGIYTLRNLADTDKIRECVDRLAPRSAVVVGGGFIGLEMVENLAHRGVHVTVIEALDQVMAPLDFEMAAMIHEHLTSKGVDLILGDPVSGFSEDNGRLGVQTQRHGTLEADMVILAIGVKPEVDLARAAGLDIGELGGIRTNSAMQTSDPAIYAVGDAVEVRDFVTGHLALIPLAGPANKQGRVAADNAMGRRTVFRGSQGTAVVKVFDLTVAATGANEKNLKRLGIPYLVSHTHSGSHAGYYPGAETMAVKLIFGPADGRLLGAQIIGPKGVDKRIDVLATAIRGHMTVYDLEELELAYAPPFGSAKDPVNIAGFVAANRLKGDSEAVQWHELENRDPDKQILLDLRTPIELKMSGAIEGALNIPIDDLRDRLTELDPAKEHIVFCAVGLRGYVGHRILRQNGFKSRNLSGGFRTFAPTDKNLRID